MERNVDSRPFGASHAATLVSNFPIGLHTVNKQASHATISTLECWLSCPPYGDRLAGTHFGPPGGQFGMVRFERGAWAMPNDAKGNVAHHFAGAADRRELPPERLSAGSQGLFIPFISGQFDQISRTGLTLCSVSSPGTPRCLPKEPIKCGPPFSHPSVQTFYFLAPPTLYETT